MTTSVHRHQRRGFRPNWTHCARVPPFRHARALLSLFRKNDQRKSQTVLLSDFDWARKHKWTLSAVLVTPSCLTRENKGQRVTDASSARISLFALTAKDWLMKDILPRTYLLCSIRNMPIRKLVTSLLLIKVNWHPISPYLPKFNLNYILLYAI